MPLSRFLKTLERDGIVAILHVLNPAPIFVPKETWENYLADPQAVPDLDQALRTIGLLVDSDVTDQETLASIKSSTIDVKLMSILYLILTKACNFRCRQCFQVERHLEHPPGKLKQKKVMTEEVARLAIDSFARHIAESEDAALEPQIQFYGGEPLLNQKTLRYAVSYIHELQSEGRLPEDLRLVIVTNGSLVTESIARYLAENKVSVGLSVDGPQAENDEFRLTANGQGTYNTIKRALRLLQKHGASVTLSVTVNPNIVGKLPAIIRWAKEEMGVESIGFNPIGGKSFGYTGTHMTRAAYDQMLAVGLVDAFRTARKIDLYEDRVGRKVSDFINESFRAVDCGAVGNQLVAFPDGSLGFCHASDDYCVSSVFDQDFRIFNHPRVEEWKGALPINRPECLACPAISVCGYGCQHNVLEMTGSIVGRDEQFCLHSKAVMDFLVWDLYDKTRAETAA